MSLFATVMSSRPIAISISGVDFDVLLADDGALMAYSVDMAEQYLDLTAITDKQLDGLIAGIQASPSPGRSRALIYLLLQRDCRV